MEFHEIWGNNSDNFEGPQVTSGRERTGGAAVVGAVVGDDLLLAGKATGDTDGRLVRLCAERSTGVREYARAREFARVRESTGVRGSTCTRVYTVVSGRAYHHHRYHRSTELRLDRCMFLLPTPNTCRTRPRGLPSPWLTQAGKRQCIRSTTGATGSS